MKTTELSEATPAPPVDKNDCWIWALNRTSRGYGRLWIKGRSSYAHRVSFEIHHRPLLAGELVCHHCDTPLCINPEHLFAGSNDDNMKDMVRKGRQAKGERSGLRLHRECVRRVIPLRLPVQTIGNMRQGENHHKTKLTKAQVIEIRRRYSETLVFQTELAQEFGVSQAAIWCILKGKNWKSASE